MRRLLVIATMFMSLLLPSTVLVGQAAAIDVFNLGQNKYSCGQGSGNGIPDVCGAGAPTKTNPIVSLIKAAIDIISIVVGAASIITIIVSGLRFVTSGGDSNAMASARTGLIYSLVGIAVTVLAQVIVVYVLNQ